MKNEQAGIYLCSRCFFYAEVHRGVGRWVLQVKNSHPETCAHCGTMTTLPYFVLGLDEVKVARVVEDLPDDDC